MKLSAKSFTRINLLYGFLVVIANIFGVLIPNVFIHSELVSSAIDEWLHFLNDYKTINIISQYMTFVIPTILCFVYSYSKASLESKLINCPIVYSTCGISGWIFYGILEIIFLIVAVNLGYNIDVKKILISSFLNIGLEAIVTFTVAYFLTETINRKFVLPKYFSEGHIKDIKGVKQPSITFLFVVNYISVTLFPLVFVVVAYVSLLIETGHSLKFENVIVMVIILIIGAGITFSFKNYFEKPLTKLTARIKKIKNGDYKTRVSITTNDSLGELSDVINDMAESIEQKTQKLIESQNSIITGMAIMIEGRDNSTGGHIKRTSDCVSVFVNELKVIPEFSYISDNFWKNLIKAAPMHDLGKIAVDDAVLRKPGKFTDEEYEIMKKHSAEGAKIVEKVLSGIEDLEFKQIAINVAHYHHEKWNGQGYPTKISGEEIPLEARIMALADVFDALVSKRCYKNSFSYDKAFEIIQDSLGSHFDPKLGEIFIKCRSQLETLYNSY